MQTALTQQLLDTAAGREAESILRACVHCGFCTATCPTYQLTGDELDGPRGRIYLMKQVMEGQPVSARTQLHLDRCLTCRSCETTCPSGVKYGHLLDIGRELVETSINRPWSMQAQRWALRKLLPYPARFRLLLGLGRLFRKFLPAELRAKLPLTQKPGARPVSSHRRRMLILEGCAQSVATPATNDSAARVLDRLGISLISAAGQGCCGAVSQHLAAPAEAGEFMRRNIDAWWPHIENGAEAIIVSASGCGVQVRDYAYLLKHDPQYAQKAARVSELTRDLSEVLGAENLEEFTASPGQRIAFQSPCTLQHGLQLAGNVEAILKKLGYKLVEVADSHLCCGSAGTYSILQPGLSRQLQSNKLQNLRAGNPQLIVTANVGCQLHLQGNSDVPVRHWIELLDQTAWVLPKQEREPE